jgi:hypothetical protein
MTFFSKGYRCGRHRLVDELGHDTLADRRILLKLLLEPFGVLVNVPKCSVICRYEYRRNAKH